jgi:hypothetical protein
MPDPHQAGALFFKQYYVDCLSRASYLVGDVDAGRAAVIDPRRDIQEYLDDAEASGLQITHVIETQEARSPRPDDRVLREWLPIEHCRERTSTCGLRRYHRPRRWNRRLARIGPTVVPR